MAKELTRNGVVGLELTREEVIDLSYQVKAVLRKAQCREVNCDVIDELDEVCKALASIDDMITEILDSGE
jgi:hypothetical protein